MLDNITTQHTYIYIYMCVYVCVCMCVYVCMYVCVYIYMCVCVYYRYKCEHSPNNTLYISYTYRIYCMQLYIRRTI